MKPADLLAAIGYSANAKVGTRIPKTVLLEHTSFSSADRRRLTDGIETLRWEAALKPETTGLASFVDEYGEYLEIAVLSAVLLGGGHTHRLRELVHRAVPYPVALVSQDDEGLVLSLAEKRRSQNEAEAFVLDGEPVEAVVDDPPSGFLDSLALASRPSADLKSAYEGWIESVEALLAARRTGSFVLPASPKQAAARRAALRECARIESEMRGVETRAAKARLLREKSDLNHMMVALRAKFQAAESHL